MGYPNSKKDDPAEFEDVYAGPGMWSGEEPDDPEDIEEPERTDGRQDRAAVLCAVQLFGA